MISTLADSDLTLADDDLGPADSDLTLADSDLTLAVISLLQTVISVSETEISLLQTMISLSQTVISLLQTVISVSQTLQMLECQTFVRNPSDNQGTLQNGLNIPVHHDNLAVTDMASTKQFKASLVVKFPTAAMHMSQSRQVWW